MMSRVCLVMVDFLGMKVGIWSLLMIMFGMLTFKAHPDARSYKTKSEQSFSDLCFIYGYTSADGRYSRSSHDMDIDDEVHGVTLGDGLGSPTPSNVDRSRTEWNIAMDRFFIELLLGQLEKGNKLNNNNSNTKEAWTEMLNSFNEEFAPTIRKGS